MRATHTILTRRLQLSLCLKDTALTWFESFLSDRVVSATHLGSSPLVPLNCGVPQGLVLGPILFSVYMYISDVIPFVISRGFQIHLFADDVVIYRLQLIAL